MNRHRLVQRLGRLSLAGAFAGAALPPGLAAGQELPTIRVGLAEGDDATPTLYALKTGIFKKYGVNVDMTRSPSGAASLAAVAGGAIDVAATSLLPFFSAHARGLPLQIVAPLAAYNPASPYAAILVKADAPYKSGRDLNGKTIASPALKDLNWVASMAWIDRNGGDSSTVKSIEIPSSVIAAALDDGRIDAATVTTPRYVEAVTSGKVRVLGHSYESIAKHFTFAAFVAQAEFAAKNPEAIVRFGRAIRESTRYTNVHHAETLELYAAFAKIDPKSIADAPRAFSQEYVTAKDLQPLLDISVKYKVLEHPLNPQDLISPAILKPGA